MLTSRTRVILATTLLPWACSCLCEHSRGEDKRSNDGSLEARHCDSQEFANSDEERPRASYDALVIYSRLRAGGGHDPVDELLPAWLATCSRAYTDYASWPIVGPFVVGQYVSRLIIARTRAGKVKIPELAPTMKIRRKSSASARSVHTTENRAYPSWTCS